MSNYKSCIMTLLFFSNFISVKIYALEVYCPKLPFKASIGQVVDDGWYVDFKRNSSNLFKYYYSKYFGNKYDFVEWISLGGHNYRQQKMASISCCIVDKKSKNLICVFKDIKDMRCKVLMDNENEKFVCD